MSPFCLNLRSAARASARLFSPTDIAQQFVGLRTLLVASLLAIGSGWAATPVFAQSTARGRYFPLNQTTPPGVAGQWSTIQPGFAPVFQPVRIELGAQGGKVTFFAGRDNQTATLAAPANAGLRVGSIYRLKISDLADFPGVELYPTVEMLDRLHPPRGREIEFAIPIILTAEEIAWALEGRLVTKVVYLEQPDRAAPIYSATAARTRLAQPRDNALAIADEAGRPMAIVRVGGRLPDAAAPEPGFFGTGAPVQFFEQPEDARENARR
jgi:hypothetical protein